MYNINAFKQYMIPKHFFLFLEKVEKYYKIALIKNQLNSSKSETRHFVKQTIACKIPISYRDVTVRLIKQVKTYMQCTAFIICFLVIKRRHNSINQS